VSGARPGRPGCWWTSSSGRPRAAHQEPGGVEGLSSLDFPPGVTEKTGTLAEDACQRELELSRQPRQRCLAEETQRPGVHPREAAGDGVDLPQGLVPPALAPQAKHGREQLGELAHEAHDDVAFGQHRRREDAASAAARGDQDHERRLTSASRQAGVDAVQGTSNETIRVPQTALPPEKHSSPRSPDPVNAPGNVAGAWPFRLTVTT